MVLNLDQFKKEDDGEVVELFTLEGVTYTIPAKPKANIVLKYLKNVRTRGDDYAAGVLLEDLLGTEGYDALMNYEDLTGEQLEMVMLAAQTVVLGALEASGKGGNG